MSETLELLSRDEIKALIISLGTSRGDDGFTTEEAQRIVEWGELARLNQIAMKSILEGTMLIDWNGVEPVFKLPKTAGGDR